MSLDRDRARLLELLTQLSFEKRRVTLSSGKESDFYIDCKRTVLTAEGHFLVGRLLWRDIQRLTPAAAAVGGLTLGADPLASAVSFTSYLAGSPIPAFIVRKEPKGHGTGEWIEGRSLIADRAEVAVVEDVVTTGGSGLKACERLEQAGLKVAGVFALVDRQEGGREAFSARGYGLISLFTKADFLDEGET